MQAGMTLEISIWLKSIMVSLCFQWLRHSRTWRNIPVIQDINLNGKTKWKQIQCNDHVNGGSSIPSKVSRKTKPDNTVVNIKGVQVGGSDIVIIAGPCAVESREQLFETARSVKTAEPIS